MWKITLLHTRWNPTRYRTEVNPRGGYNLVWRQKYMGGKVNDRTGVYTKWRWWRWRWQLWRQQVLQKFQGQKFVLALSPQQGWMLPTDKRTVFSFSVCTQNTRLGRKHTTELFSLSRSNNVKCSPSLESCICKLVGMKQQLWLMLTCYLLSRQNSAVVNNGSCHYTPYTWNLGLFGFL